MDEKDFKQAIIKHFGTMCEDNVDELLTRFSMTVAALKFAGNQGDNPLCVLNRFFEGEAKN